MNKMKIYDGLVNSELFESCKKRYGQNYHYDIITGTECRLEDLEGNQRVCAGDGKTYFFLMTPKEEKPKLMSFGEAREKALKMFKTGYFSVYYSFNRHESCIQNECGIYHAGFHEHFIGQTFEQVFLHIESYMMNIEPPEEITPEESEQITKDIIPQG